MTGAAAGPVTQPTPGRSAVASFLTEQAECLATGLEHADDPLAVRAVLRSHDAAHDRWLQCISGVASLDEGTADELAALYALHGRVAGSLEHDRYRSGGRAVRVHVRRLLAQQLRSATARTIASLPPP